MKQKNKQNILKGIKVVLLASVLGAMVFSSVAVYAQSSCNPDNDSPGSCMAFGGTPNPDGTCSCPSTRSPGVSGSACSVSNPCGAGLTCSSQTSTCVVEDAGPGPTVEPSIPGGVPPGTGLPGNVTSACPAGLSLDSKSGLCLPPQQFKTGIAASTDLMSLIFSVIKLLLLFAGVVAVFILVIGGYLYMSSGGNEEQAEKGKKTVTNFALGLFIIIMAYAIVTIIGNTLTDNKFVSGSNSAPFITNSQ